MMECLLTEFDLEEIQIAASNKAACKKGSKSNSYCLVSSGNV